MNVFSQRIFCISWFNAVAACWTVVANGNVNGFEHIPAIAPRFLDKFDKASKSLSPSIDGSIAFPSPI